MVTEIKNLFSGLLLSDLSRAGLARDFLIASLQQESDLPGCLLQLGRRVGLKGAGHYESLAHQAWQQKIRACLFLDPAYPLRLAQISGFPLVLYYSGQAAALKWNHPFIVAVVGSRQPTAYGRRVTAELTAKLVQENCLIVSGLARGIDGLAHQTCLARGGLTIAVLAHGLDLVYPPEHKQLLEAVRVSGLIVSEHPPGTRPQRQYFPARNRILSGLADLVAIMEAAEKSGSLITAGFAADQGREVLAVPGSIYNSQSKGCHQLIKDGAAILQSSADILACRPLWGRQNQENF